MDKVLITGGAGFLGYHLAHHFANKGAKIALLDIAPYEESEYPSGTEFYTVDVRNREQVRAAHAERASNIFKRSWVVRLGPGHGRHSERCAVAGALKAFK